MSDHYRTLGLQPNASKSDIKNAYFRLAHRYHPDHHAKADAAGRAMAAAWFRRAKDAYEVLSDDRRRAQYDRTVRSSSSASSSGHGNRYGQYSGGASSASSSGHGNNRQRGQNGSGGGTTNSTEPDWDWRERARARCNGGGTYSSSSGSGNRQAQNGGASSSSSGGGTYSATESGAEWIFERARARGQGGTSSSTASGHGGGFGSRLPQRVTRQMVALVCCAGVIGGSALLWSVYKRSARKQES